MTHPTPEGLSPQTAEDYLRGRYGAYRGHFAWRELEEAFNGGLRAQAATIEAICKIIECAGPEAADEIADLLGYPSVEWPSDQAASVEPVGEVQWAAGVEGSFREVVFFDQPSPPAGTKLYASAPPSPASVPEVDVPLRKVVFSVLEGFTLPHAVRKILESAYYTPSPATAVDAVDELREALRMGVECLRNQKSLHPEDFDELDERAVALLKAALATTKEVK